MLKGKGKRKMNENDQAMKIVKKLWQPNWKHQEVVVLVQAKQKEHVASLDIIDSKGCFESVVLKWKKKITTIMDSRYNAHMWNELVGASTIKIDIFFILAFFPTSKIQVTFWVS
jgi:hypothetical protein